MGFCAPIADREDRPGDEHRGHLTNKEKQPMGAVRDVLSSFLMDATPEERARVFRLLFRLVVSVYITWAIGVYAPLGFNGVARADDVDQKIQGALQPVTAQLGQITTQLAGQDEVLRQIRADQLATKLRELKRTCCLA